MPKSRLHPKAPLIAPIQIDIVGFTSTGGSGVITTDTMHRRTRARKTARTVRDEIEVDFNWGSDGRTPVGPVGPEPTEVLILPPTRGGPPAPLLPPTLGGPLFIEEFRVDDIPRIYALAKALNYTIETQDNSLTQPNSAKTGW